MSASSATSHFICVFRGTKAERASVVHSTPSKSAKCATPCPTSWTSTSTRNRVAWCATPLRASRSSATSRAPRRPCATPSSMRRTLTNTWSLLAVYAPAVLTLSSGFTTSEFAHCFLTISTILREGSFFDDSDNVLGFKGPWNNRANVNGYEDW